MSLRPRFSRGMVTVNGVSRKKTALHRDRTVLPPQHPVSRNQPRISLREIPDFRGLVELTHF
jgi:hypothetical protein